MNSYWYHDSCSLLVIANLVMYSPIAVIVPVVF